MVRKLMVVTSLSVIVALALSAGALAGKFNKQVNIGDNGPKFTKLIGTDDKKHSMDDYKEAKVLVVAFTCNHCPVAVAYEGRFIEFAKKYKDKGVAFVAINVNNLPADKLPAMKVRAKEKGFNFPYLYDPTQKIAREYGATSTPHLFVLCQKRGIAYMGAFDDSNNPKRVKNRYLPDAVDSLLAGKTVEVTETRQRGCSIKYERK